LRAPMRSLHSVARLSFEHGHLPSAPAMRRDLTSETGCASYGYERDTGDRTLPQRDNLTLSWLREEAARRYLSQRTHVLKSPHLHRPRRRDGGRREGPAGPVGRRAKEARARATPSGPALRSGRNSRDTLVVRAEIAAKESSA